MTRRTSWLPATNVSIVVPAYNEEANIEPLLDSLLHQELAHTRVLEITVVASGCTDATAARARSVARGRPGVHIHVQEQRLGKVAAINSFLRHRDPRADLVIVCSADLRVAPDVIEKIGAYFRANPEVGMVGTRPVPDNEPRDLASRMVHVLWELHHRISLASPKMGELVAFRAPLVESVSELSVVDEASIENIVRVKGFGLGYVADAVVTNHGPETLREYLEQRRRVARGHYWLEFAFGYRVATLDKRLVGRTVLNLFLDQTDARDRAALGAAILTEAVARGLGFWDARIVGGKHRTWTPLPSTKTLRHDRKERIAS